ncbi:MAG: YvcK family protein [Elusimicrobia bacterium]|nr:YvcK family protein [Elusimicrobiota bacterium]
MERSVKKTVRPSGGHSLARSMGTVLLVMAYLMTNVSGLYSAETDFWKDRRNAARQHSSHTQFAQLSTFTPHSAPRAELFSPVERKGIENSVSVNHRSLPPGAEEQLDWLPELVAPFGDLGDVFLSGNPTAPLIIHLQDAHESLDAQNAQAGIIEALGKRGVSLVGLEGATGPFSLDGVRTSQNADINRGVADLLMRLGYIGGAEFVRLSAEASLLLWGVETEGLYNQNLAAFSASEMNRATLIKGLAVLKSLSDQAVASVYSPRLRKFDSAVASYEEGRTHLGDHVDFLWTSYAGSAKDYPHLMSLQKAFAIEKTMDFKAVEKERKTLVDLLSHRLTPAQLQNVVTQSVSYRLGRISHADYHSYLRSISKQNGIHLDQFSQVDRYMKYLALADGIDRGALLSELPSMERAVESQLVQNPKEKVLAQCRRNLSLLNKLAHHAMTPADWTLYVTSRDDVQKIHERLAGLSGRPAPPEGSVLSPALLQSFEKFSMLALERNPSLVQNLLEKVKAEKASVAVLVAGGFHTEGMTALLKKADVSYAVVTPRIGEIPNNSQPLQSLIRDPLPLEKLLAGEVITLQSPRLLAAHPPQVSPALQEKIQRNGRAVKLIPLVVGTLLELLVAGKPLPSLAHGRIVESSVETSSNGNPVAHVVVQLPFSESDGQDQGRLTARAAFKIAVDQDSNLLGPAYRSISPLIVTLPEGEVVVNVGPSSQKARGGRWPWLEWFYGLAGKGGWARVGLPVIMESLLPAAGLLWAGVDPGFGFWLPLLLGVGYQLVWHLGHLWGAEGTWPERFRFAFSAEKLAISVGVLLLHSVMFSGMGVVQGASERSFAWIAGLAIPHAVMNSVLHINRDGSEEEQEQEPRAFGLVPFLMPLIVTFRAILVGYQMGLHSFRVWRLGSRVAHPARVVVLGGGSGPELLGKVFQSVPEARGSVKAVVSNLNDSGRSSALQGVVGRVWEGQRSLRRQGVRALPRFLSRYLNGIPVETVPYMGYPMRAMEGGISSPWVRALLAAEITDYSGTPEDWLRTLVEEVSFPERMQEEDSQFKENVLKAIRSRLQAIPLDIQQAIRTDTILENLNRVSRPQPLRNLLFLGALYRDRAVSVPGIIHRSNYYRAVDGLVRDLDSSVVPLMAGFESSLEVRPVGFDETGRRAEGEKSIGLGQEAGPLKRIDLEDVRHGHHLGYLPQAEPEAVRAINESAEIYIGPGSLTSLVGALAPAGVVEALMRAKARGVPITWLFNPTQNPETAGLSPVELVKLLEHSLSLEGRRVSLKSFLTDVVVNVPEESPEELSTFVKEESLYALLWGADPENMRRAAKTVAGFWESMTPEEIQVEFEDVLGTRVFVLPLVGKTQDGRFLYRPHRLLTWVALRNLHALYGILVGVFDKDDTLAKANTDIDSETAKAIARALWNGAVIAPHTASSFEELLKNLDPLFINLTYRSGRGFRLPAYLLGNNLPMIASIMDARLYDSVSKQYQPAMTEDLFESVAESFEKKVLSEGGVIVEARVGLLAQARGFLTEMKDDPWAEKLLEGMDRPHPSTRFVVALWLEALLAREQAHPLHHGSRVERRPAAPKATAKTAPESVDDLLKFRRVQYVLRNIPSIHRSAANARIQEEIKRSGLPLEGVMAGTSSINFIPRGQSKKNALALLVNLWKLPSMRALLLADDKPRIEEVLHAVEAVLVFFGAMGNAPRGPLPHTTAIVPEGKSVGDVRVLIDAMGRILETVNPGVRVRLGARPVAWAALMRKMVVEGWRGKLLTGRGPFRQGGSVDGEQKLAPRANALEEMIFEEKQLERLNGVAATLKNDGVRYVIYVGVGGVGPMGRMMDSWPAGSDAARIFPVEHIDPGEIEALRRRLINAEETPQERALIGLGFTGVQNRVWRRAIKKSSLVIVSKGMNEEGKEEIQALTNLISETFEQVDSQNKEKAFKHIFYFGDPPVGGDDRTAVGWNWATSIGIRTFPLQFDGGRQLLKRFLHPGYPYAFLLALKGWSPTTIFQSAASFARKGESGDAFFRLAAWFEGYVRENKNQAVFVFPPLLEGLSPLTARSLEPGLLTQEGNSPLISYDVPLNVAAYGDAAHSRAVFVHVRQEGVDDPNAEAIETLRRAGHPVAEVTLPNDLPVAFAVWMEGMFRMAAALGAMEGKNSVTTPVVEAYNQAMVTYKNQVPSTPEPTAHFGTVGMNDESAFAWGQVSRQEVERLMVDAGLGKEGDAADRYAAIFYLLNRKTAADGPEISEIRYLGSPSPTLVGALKRGQAVLSSRSKKIVRLGRRAHADYQGSLARPVYGAPILLETVVWSEEMTSTSWKSDHSDAQRLLRGDSLKLRRYAALTALQTAPRAPPTVLLTLETGKGQGPKDLHRFFNKVEKRFKQFEDMHRALTPGSGTSGPHEKNRQSTDRKPFFYPLIFILAVSAVLLAPFLSVIAFAGEMVPSLIQTHGIWQDLFSVFGGNVGISALLITSVSLIWKFVFRSAPVPRFQSGDGPGALTEPVRWGQGSEHPGDAVVIGDADAHLAAVEKILKAEKLVNDAGHWIGGRRAAVQVGDVVGRGDQAMELYTHLFRIQEEARRAGGDFILLMGNHEMALLIGEPIGGDFKEGEETLREKLRTLLMNGVLEGRLQGAAVLEGPDGKSHLVTHAGYSEKLKGALYGTPVWEEWLEEYRVNTGFPEGADIRADNSALLQFFNQSVRSIAEHVRDRPDKPAKTHGNLRQLLNRSNGLLMGSEGIMNRVASFVDEGLVPIHQIFGHSVGSTVRFQDKEGLAVNTDSGLYRPDRKFLSTPRYFRLGNNGSARSVEIGRFGELRVSRLASGYDRPNPSNLWAWIIEIKDRITLRVQPLEWLRLHVDHANTLEELVAAYQRFYDVLGRGHWPWVRRHRPVLWAESQRLLIQQLWDQRAPWSMAPIGDGENPWEVIQIHEDRMDDLLRRAQEVWNDLPDRKKGEFLPAFLASRQNSVPAISADQKNQLDLELQHSPVAISIRETGFAGVHELLIEATPDRVGLLADMAGITAAHGFHVLLGDVRAIDGPVLGRFFVSGLAEDFEERKEQRDQMEKDFLDLVKGHATIEDIFSRYERPYRFTMSGRPGSPPSVVGFHNGNLSILTPDRVEPGLLHVIARKLAELGCNIALAPESIHTQGDTVYDFFNVTGPDGKTSLTPQQKIQVIKGLEFLLNSRVITQDNFAMSRDVFDPWLYSEGTNVVAFSSLEELNRELLGGRARSLKMGTLTADVDRVRRAFEEERSRAQAARVSLEDVLGTWELRGEDGQLSEAAVLRTGQALGKVVREDKEFMEDPVPLARRLAFAALLSLGEVLDSDTPENWNRWAILLARGFNDKLFDAEEVVTTSLQENRHQVIVLSDTLLSGNPTPQDETRLAELEVLARQAPHLSGKSRLSWVLPDASASLEALWEKYPALAPLRKVDSSTWPQSEFRGEDGNYSVKKLLFSVQGVRQVSDLRPTDVFLMNRNGWVVEEDLPNDVVRLLISLVGGLVYDATTKLGEEINQLYYLRINA